MTTANTKKSELRRISQKSSLVTPMLEGRKGATRFDFEDVLPAYNRNPLYSRALTTQNNEVHETPFNGALAFVQNVEQFTSKAAKERVVSLNFLESDLTDDSYAAWQLLGKYSFDQLAYIGHRILSNRQLFEQEIVQRIRTCSELLQRAGVDVPRIADNHAIPYAALDLLCEHFGFSGYETGLARYIQQTAKTKIETARSESFLADYFFECLFECEPSTPGMLNNGGYIIENGEIIVHMKTALGAINETWNKSELFNALNKSDYCIGQKTSRAFDTPRSCWFFKKSK